MLDKLELPTSQTGFRLHHLEVLNWGTFNQKIWQIEPTGMNSLLTGDIGSGKSTLVDALTTLLVPHHKITYNKAAGAESKERTLYSYIRGEFKNQKNELDNTSKAVHLRDGRNHTVLLAYFVNEGYRQGVTLAQVFWLKDERPEKLFIVSEQILSIGEHFTKFDGDVTLLEKRLKTLSDTATFKHFSDYGSRFRNIFGIRSEKALELFYQTVSMKSVGNLTDFVRNQMLEKTEVKDKIQEIKRNFENLTRAYEAVQKAKKQLLQLQPLISDAEKFETLSNEIKELQNCIDALPVFFAIEKIRLLEIEINQLSQNLLQRENKAGELTRDLEMLRSKKDKIKSSIENNAEGKLLGEMERSIREKELIKDNKFAKASEYEELAKKLSLPGPSEEKVFYASLTAAGKLEQSLIADEEKLRSESDELKIGLRKLEEKQSELLAELKSLQQRKTQIPERNLKIRANILTDLALKESDLPFVGELLKVKETEKEWEGAIERLLHNFALSVLVPEEEYKRVSNYVNKTNLHGRFVYFRVPQDLMRKKRQEIGHNSLVHKIEIKADTAFYAWMENELMEKFDFVCCELMEEFQREFYAITKQGQIKTGRFKHEKNDSRDIADKKNYVLGWSNTEKIGAIALELTGLEKKVTSSITAIELNKQQVTALSGKKLVMHDFIKFRDFNEINWKKEVGEYQKLLSEKEELEKSSDHLKKLRKQFDAVKEELRLKENEEKENTEQSGGLKVSIQRYRDNLTSCQSIANILTLEEQKAFFPKVQELIKGYHTDIDAIDGLQNVSRQKLEGSKSEKNKIERPLRDGLIKKMQIYKTDYPEDTSDVDASIESINDFKTFLKRIEEDDLPKHEKKFKELLNEGTINDIAMFKNQLEISEKDIRAKINKINASLKDIEYNRGRYIQIVPGTLPDLDIKEFQIQLKGCLENTLGQAELYNEEKFSQVKKIIDRFNSGQPADIAWTNKVTDVRNWFVFNASIRYSETDVEDEFIKDASGKSGGQKEKLAYTILASALAYQFGLEKNAAKSRSFRFVVIDEAFGRGSDESTRYGLELFKKMDLQLLIVTPLQKINIIEDYISAVHFVSNMNGDNSEVLNLTKQQYLEDKDKYLNKIAV